MYNYNKVRNRTTFPSKDGYTLGPQFHVQATATTVTERPVKQGSAGSRDSPTQKQVDAADNSPVLRRTASSQPTDIQYNHGSDGRNSHHYVPHPATIHPSHMTRNVASSRHGNKMHMLPSTAYAHDLTTPAPCEDPPGRLLYQHSMAGHGHTKTTSYLPGDRVVFAENPSTPGVPIVYRTSEERNANPDRLNLDRRRLNMCPVLEGEDQLRLLNFQHNMILRIQHLSSLRRLIFLDLYDNQIEEISGLTSLKSLRVLMLGKNKISRIENLGNLNKLDVLDLHGNQIVHIEHLNHLGELRVLNLAGNNIEHVDNLSGMEALTELNLRRNKIRTVSDVESLPSLQRLFLSFNEVTCFEDISCLGDSRSLVEVSLDSNPIAQESHYKQTMLRNMQSLRQLDMKRVSEDERRIASVMAKKEEEKKRESNKLAIMKEKRNLAISNARRCWSAVQREMNRQLQDYQQMCKLPLEDLYSNRERRRLAISNARRQWEVMQGGLMGRANRLVKSSMPDLVASHVANVPSLALNDDEESSRPDSAKSSMSEGTWPGRSSSRAGSRSSSHSRAPTPEKSSSNIDLSASLNVDHLAELEGDTLSLYGVGSLESLDKNWGIQAAGAVSTITFKFVDFELVAKHLHKIRARFPSVHTLIFNSTNIHSLSQLNALSSVRRLDNLIVENEGNPVTQYLLWRNYLLFRLAHFQLKKINNVEVSATDIVNAERFFGPLAHITTSQLPQSRLASLLGETKRKQLQGNNTDKTSRGSLLDIKVDRSNTESVGRAGLVYSPQDALQQRAQEQESRLHFVKNYVKDLSQEAIQVDHKLSALQRAWPSLFHEMVHTAVVDMWDSQAYMKRCMEELEKS